MRISLFHSLLFAALAAVPTVQGCANAYTYCNDLGGTVCECNGGHLVRRCFHSPQMRTYKSMILDLSMPEHEADLRERVYR